MIKGERYKQLMQLCHPHKHHGSKLSTDDAMAERDATAGEARQQARQVTAQTRQERFFRGSGYLDLSDVPIASPALFYAAGCCCRASPSVHCLMCFRALGAGVTPSRRHCAMVRWTARVSGKQVANGDFSSFVSP